VPVIEEFAQQKIGRSGPPFNALYALVCAYSDAVKRQTTHRDLAIKPQAILRALTQARREKQIASDS